MQDKRLEYLNWKRDIPLAVAAASAIIAGFLWYNGIISYWLTPDPDPRSPYMRRIHEAAGRPKGANPYSWDYGRDQSKLEKSESQRCQGCHGKMQGKKPDGRPKYPIHAAMSDMDLFEFQCVDCHKKVDLGQRNPKRATIRINRKHCTRCHESNEQLRGPDTEWGRGVLLISNHGTDKVSGKKWIDGHSGAAQGVGVKKCYRCHQPGSELDFCTSCHKHPRNWLAVHVNVAKKTGAETCLGCHRLGSGTTFCDECHSKFWMNSLRAKAPESFGDPAKNRRYCWGCHANPKLTKLLGRSSWPYVGKVLEQSVHKNLACIDCHEFTSKHPEDLPKNFRRLAGLACMKCHKKQAREYKVSVHGRLALGNQRGRIAGRAAESPVCSGCHGFHGIQSYDQPSTKLKHKFAGKEMCGNCHIDRYLDFSDYYHGKAYKNRETDAPACRTCHGDHKIVEKSDPVSPVARRNLPETCGQCHDRPTSVNISYAPLIHNRRLALEENFLYNLLTLFGNKKRSVVRFGSVKAVSEAIGPSKKR